MSDERENDEGWAGLDSLAHIKQARADMERTMNEVNDRLAAPFLGDAGRKMLELLIERVVRPPSWRPGDTLEAAYFREGQKDIVNQLVTAVNAAQARASAGGSTQA